MAPSATSPRRLLAAQHRSEIVRLRVEGKTIQTIADELDLSTSTVHGSLKTELKNLASQTQERTEEYRELTLQRLESMWLALFPKISQGHVPSVTAGVSVLDRISRLMGLDAPTRIDSRVSFEDRTNVELLEEADRMGLKVDDETRRLLLESNSNLSMLPAN